VSDIQWEKESIDSRNEYDLGRFKATTDDSVAGICYGVDYEAHQNIQGNMAP
jgi:hypothetical protein